MTVCWHWWRDTYPEVWLPHRCNLPINHPGPHICNCTATTDRETP